MNTEVIRCAKCKYMFPVNEKQKGRCPDCGSKFLRMASTKELQQYQLDKRMNALEHLGDAA